MIETPEGYQEVDLTKHSIVKFPEGSKLFRRPDGKHEYFETDLTGQILRSVIDASVFQRDEAVKVALYEQGWIIKKRDDCSLSDTSLELHLAQARIRRLTAEVAALKDQRDRIIAIAEEDV